MVIMVRLTKVNKKKRLMQLKMEPRKTNKCILQVTINTRNPSKLGSQSPCLRLKTGSSQLKIVSMSIKFKW